MDNSEEDKLSGMRAAAEQLSAKEKA